MKSTAVILFMLLSFGVSAIPKPVACSIRHDGRLKIWFEYVLPTNGPSGEACLNCHTPGWKRCMPSNAESFPGMADQVELKIVEYLFVQSDLLIEGGQMSGALQERVQVQGESFMRVYECKWNLDQNGNGEVKITRDDI